MTESCHPSGPGLLFASASFRSPFCHDQSIRPAGPRILPAVGHEERVRRLRHALWLSAIGGSLLILALSLCGPLFQLAPRPAEAVGPIATLSSRLLPSPESFGVQGDLPLITAVAWQQTIVGGVWRSLWPPLVLLALIAGAVWGWLRMLRGRVQLGISERKEENNHSREYDRVIRELPVWWESGVRFA